MKIKIAIAFLFLSLFVFYLFRYIDNAKDQTIQELNEHSLLTVEATYNAVINTYEIAAKKDFNFFMNRSDVLNLLHSFKDAQTPQEQNILRGELYRHLYKDYDVMKKMHVRQFHLHTNDGKSLLRMHLPYENGDSLIDFRPSIRIVNQEHKSVIGFEGGRIFPGYRYVYPIMDKGEYLGSVEFSVAFEGIEEKLNTLLPNYIYQLIISKDESYNKVFSWHRRFFTPSRFGGDYYLENPELSNSTELYLNNELISRLIVLAKSSSNFNFNLAAHKDFSVPIIDADKGYAVNFITIKNTSNKAAGYVVCFSLENEIAQIAANYKKYKIFALLMSIIVFTLFFVIVIQIEKLRRSKNKLKSINHSLSEAQKIAHFGFIEYDHLKDRYYLSEEVYNIFGVNPKYFKPSYQVLLSHVHPDDVKKVHKAYTESIINKTIYITQHRLIQESGEVVFVEEHGNHEFNAEGEIVKSIGSIYDITQQMIAYENLERFIDLQTSIVILTDGIHFSFANKSFYHFFGFEDLAAFKEESLCICDRFIQQNGFFSLADVKEGEVHWIESLLNLSLRQRIVFMFDTTATPHAFGVSINKYDTKSYVVEFNDISDSMIEKLQLEKQLNRDQLTGAYNRTYFETNIEQVLKLNRAKGLKTGIVFFDIDHFKLINDSYGHDMGDEVLISLVKLVKEQIRKYDHLVRWGGEEFIIIARTTSLQSLLQMTQKIRIEIANHKFKAIPNLTCSFGIAIHQEEEPIKLTITRADEKLYEAKESGRNQVK